MGKTGLSASRRPMFGEQQRFVLLLIAPAALLLLLFQVVPIVIGASASPATSAPATLRIMNRKVFGSTT